MQLNQLIVIQILHLKIHKHIQCYINNFIGYFIYFFINNSFLVVFEGKITQISIKLFKMIKKILKN